MPLSVRRRGFRCTQPQLQSHDRVAEGRVPMFERRCGQEFREGCQGQGENVFGRRSYRNIKQSCTLTHVIVIVGFIVPAHHWESHHHDASEKSVR